jgi:two-component system response regulator HydG
MIKTSSTILVVDDDQGHRTMLKTLLRGWGYEIQLADDGETAVAAVEQEAFDLVLMDIRMVRMSGIEALERIKAMNPAIPVIIMTAYGDVETAVEAVRKGAYDYLQKPLDFEGLRLKMERAMEHRSLREENRLLKESLGARFDRQNLIGHSPAMTRLLEIVAQAAPSEATILITGESGTGKEMIAGAIHFNSPRREGPFVKINCAAITETLLESELFGHEKGSFTGADRRREGRFRQAHGGSLFLDEITETSPSMQVKLLRVLQEREVTRVGGSEVIPVDVRLIAATNRSIRDEIAAGRFREDLYYRLNVVSLHVPPLRERREDIPLMAQRFLEMYNEKNRKTIKGFSPQAMDRLVRYGWPGNVRELMNAVERGVVLCRGEYLDEADFPLLSPDSLATDRPTLPSGLSLEALPLEEVEKNTVLATLEAVGGNKSEAARRLGITRRTLHLKLKKYGLM